MPKTHTFLGLFQTQAPPSLGPQKDRARGIYYLVRLCTVLGTTEDVFSVSKPLPNEKWKKPFQSQVTWMSSDLTDSSGFSSWLHHMPLWHTLTPCSKQVSFRSLTGGQGLWRGGPLHPAPGYPFDTVHPQLILSNWVCSENLEITLKFPSFVLIAKGGGWGAGGGV